MENSSKGVMGSMKEEAELGESLSKYVWSSQERETVGSAESCKWIGNLLTSES